MAASSNLLEGKLSLVTGGGSGIGRAVCQVFAREGATVSVADINMSAGQNTVNELPENSNHSSFVVDVSESDSVAKLFQDIHQTYKRSPDIVVNCAGVLGPIDLLVDCLDADFDNIVKVNLKGTFLVTRAAIKGMLAENISGSVINMSSICAKSGYLTLSIYASTKAAVLAFTKSVAQEVAEKGIRCNALLPGVISTPILGDSGKLESVCLSLAPMKRLGEAEEVAEACAFLASDRSSYMTGAGVEVTGGLLM